ncbi:MAG TPA: WYL domain-containing protein [Acidimicrobiales bacterium]
MNLTPISPRPPAWAVLAQALSEHRPVRARYRGVERFLCPHLLGWKNGRPKLLAYQAGGATSRGSLPRDTRQRWRSMFVDEIETVTIADRPWETADNYSLDTNNIDHIELAVPELN